MKRKSAKKKRVLSEEQLRKMREGREKAKQKREEAVKTKERVDKLADLDKRLAEGRKNANYSSVRIKAKRRRSYSK